jgi:hypothetical protein
VSDDAADERPYTGPERRLNVELHVSADELQDWREGTRRLTEEVEQLNETLEGLASKADVAKSSKVVLRKGYLVTAAVGLVLLALIIGGMITAVVFKQQSRDFRNATADSCKLRNDATLLQGRQSMAAFNALLVTLDKTDPDVANALRGFARAAPQPVLPDCDKLRNP